MQQLHFSPISLYNWLRRITLRLGRCHRQITFSLPIQPFLSTYCGLLAWFSHCLALLLLPWYNNGLVIISRLLSVDLHPTPRVCNSGFCIIASLIFFKQHSSVPSSLRESRVSRWRLSLKTSRQSCMSRLYCSSWDLFSSYFQST